MNYCRSYNVSSKGKSVYSCSELSVKPGVIERGET